MLDTIAAFASSTLEEHSTLYFSDGDIILAVKLAPAPPPDSGGNAADTKDRYQVYRVHKFLLSRHSQVFANMFSDAAPGGSYDGVPMIEMVGDDPELFSRMLSFFYSPS